jgi:hypothetical protein
MRDENEGKKFHHDPTKGNSPQSLKSYLLIPQKMGLLMIGQFTMYRYSDDWTYLWFLSEVPTSILFRSVPGSSVTTWYYKFQIVFFSARNGIFSIIGATEESRPDYPPEEPALTRFSNLRDTVEIMTTTSAAPTAASKACILVRYCNADCQRNHWAKHKKECKQRAAELRDEALFKDPPAKEDCPICFLPMPTRLIYCISLPSATISSVPICEFAIAKEGWQMSQWNNIFHVAERVSVKGACTPSISLKILGIVQIVMQIE